MHCTSITVIAVGRADSPEVIAERGRIIGLSESGATVTNIAHRIGRSVKMVRKWIRRWEEEGSVKTKPRSGRPRATSPRTDALIVAAAERHPMRTSAQHTEHLGLNCNPMTLRRRLHEAGIHCHIPAYKGWLTPAHKE
ncbi:uncharacterized protein LOC135225396 [Macrobrachium nipponense]|uniref:uncharacterized protein LOC135225396 n=1 Tax=Macrobrachium nipponense TaxID=159736 RepID=UPI0030C7D8C5